MADIKRGQIYMVDFGAHDGSKQGGFRPAIVVSNNKANRFSPVIMVCCISTKIHKRMPTHVRLNRVTAQLRYDSIVLCEQVHSINKTELGNYIGSVDSHDEAQVDRALKISLGLLDEPMNVDRFVDRFVDRSA